VHIATRYGLQYLGFKARWEQEIFFSPHTSRPTLDRVPERGDVALINHYHLAPASRMSRFISLLPLCACLHGVGHLYLYLTITVQNLLRSRLL